MIPGIGHSPLHRRVEASEELLVELRAEFILNVGFGDEVHALVASLTLAGGVEVEALGVRRRLRLWLYLLRGRGETSNTMMDAIMNVTTAAPAPTLKLCVCASFVLSLARSRQPSIARRAPALHSAAALAPTRSLQRVGHADFAGAVREALGLAAAGGGRGESGRVETGLENGMGRGVG